MLRLFPSLHSRTLAVAILAVMLPLIVLWVLFWSSARPRIQAEQDAARAKSLQQAGRLLEAHLVSSIRYLELIGSSPLLVGDPEKRHKELVRMSESLFEELSLWDENGFRIDSSRPGSRAIQEFSPYFKRAMDKREITVSEPFLSEDDSTILLAFYIPAGPEWFPRQNILKAVIELDPGYSILSSVALDKLGDLLLLDADGNILFSHTGRPLFSKFASPHSLRQINARCSGELEVAKGSCLSFHSMNVDSFKRGEANREWTLLSLAPRTVIHANLISMNRRFAGTILATIIFLIPLCFLLIRRTTAPLMELANAALAAQQGNLAIRVPQSGLRELDQVGESFNEMLEKVSRDQEHLEHEVDQQTRRLSAALSTLSSSIDSINEGLLIFDRNGRIVSANSSFNRLFVSASSDDMIGPDSSIADLIETLQPWHREHDLGDLFRESLNHGKEIEEEWTNPGDEHRVIHVYSSPILAIDRSLIGRIWVYRDLTQVRILEDELRQSQKMEAIGTLAGGVAHDFNNLLTIINAGLTVGVPELTPGSETHASASAALTATGKATALVKQLLSFSRKSNLEIKACQLGELAEETREILSRTLSPSIKMTLDVQPDLWTVDADQNQIQQILMNLCVNARDAIGKNGSINIRIYNTRRASPSALDAGEADVVCLSVQDTGGGMSLEVKQKIFDPFFTTKEQGKGTGLGLSTCYGIVKQHAGWMECQSEPGQGTVMNVYLPKGDLTINAEEAPEPTPPRELRHHKAIEPSRLTILVADDEPAVRAVAEFVLKRAGYNLITANNGAEAVKLVRERNGDIDLVMLDYTMPVMDGRDAFRAISELFPGIPVMICSGYLCDFNEFATAQGRTPDLFIQKPYAIKELPGCVADLLAQKMPPPPEAKALHEELSVHQ